MLKKVLSGEPVDVNVKYTSSPEIGAQSDTRRFKPCPLAICAPGEGSVGSQVLHVRGQERPHVMSRIESVARTLVP